MGFSPDKPGSSEKKWDFLNMVTSACHRRSVKTSRFIREHDVNLRTVILCEQVLAFTKMDSPKKSLNEKTFVNPFPLFTGQI